MTRNLNVVTEPTVEPVSLSTLRTHLRISGTAEDDLLSIYIESARRLVESITGRTLINTTYDQIMNLAEVGSKIEILKPPLSSVTDIKVKAWDDTEETATASTYIVVTDTMIGFVQLIDGNTWPDTDRDEMNFRIRFVGGYGATAASIPADLRHGVLIAAASFYENRGDEAAVYTDSKLLGFLNPKKIPTI
jgi:uncharacterized phiE125 gp8 family phage protein